MKKTKVFNIKYDNNQEYTIIATTSSKAKKEFEKRFIGSKIVSVTEVGAQG